MSSVVFHAGPSAVITRNLASGTRSPTLMGMLVILSWNGALLEFLPRADGRGPLSGSTKLARWTNYAIPSIKWRGNLDGILGGDGGDGDVDPFIFRSRRSAVEVESKALQARRRELSLERGKRKRPIGARAFGKQVHARARGRLKIDHGARARRTFLTSDRAHGERRAISKPLLSRHSRLRFGERSIARRSSLREHQFRHRLLRQAEQFADGIVDGKVQSHGRGAVLRYDDKRQNQVLRVSDHA